MPKSKPIEAPAPTMAPGNNGHQPSLASMPPEQRAQACWLDIQRVLSLYGCELVAFPSLTVEGRIVANVQIKANVNPPQNTVTPPATS